VHAYNLQLHEVCNGLDVFIGAEKIMWERTSVSENSEEPINNSQESHQE